MSATTTILYPQGTGFDMNYYLTTHMPLMQKKWSPYGLKSWKVLQFPTDSRYCVQATLEWGSFEDFQKALSSPATKNIMDDAPNFADKMPQMMTGVSQGAS
ncbi:Hypothetical protein D9617_10g075070 [Elsinoe fawcettii]|nr:Hypothetical protein D9617_10g075070 [Elsinoe fawcettii]